MLDKLMSFSGSPESLACGCITPQMLISSNIHPESYLATDYLNHYNELVMLLDLLPDMPDMMSEVVAWVPKSYPQHFEDTNFAAKQLAIEAYHCAPEEIKFEFDTVVSQLDALFVELIQKLCDADVWQYQDLVDHSKMATEPLLRQARTIINGVADGDVSLEDNQYFSDEDHLQASIDSLFD